MPCSRLKILDRRLDAQRASRLRRCALLALWAGLCFWLASVHPVCALAQEEPPGAEDAPPGDLANFRYTVRFSGLENKELIELLRSVSTTVEKAGKPVEDMFLLRGRAREDAKNFEKALASRGFFSAKVAFSVDAAVQPAVLQFAVSTGGAYILRFVDVEVSEGAPPVRFPLPEAAALGLTLEAPAISKDIVAAEAKLLAVFKNKGYPFARLETRKAVALPEEKVLHVTYVVRPGEYALFGPLQLSGLKDVKEDLVTRFIPWKQGEEYNQDQVDLFKKRLVDLGLFTTIAVAPAKSLDSQGQAAIETTVAERYKRTFKGGVSYNTDHGPGGRLHWEHRNLFGRGEKLRLSAAGTLETKLLEMRFENPFFLSDKQKFLAGIKATEEKTDAFQGHSAVAEAKITRQLAGHVTGEAGVGWRSSIIGKDAANPDKKSSSYNLVSLTAGVTADTRNDPLDATKGWMASLNISPHKSVSGENLSFVKTGFSGAAYWPLADKPLLVLAARASAGSISGVSASKLLPPDVRFYAGGSGSIRGYSYQSVGPLRGKKPLGGLSTVDFGVEARLRLTELFGVVAFLDGGNAYEKPYPDPGAGMLLGAGLGLRVFTPIGPFRVDVATPLHRRKTDDVLQLYISLGQAF